VYRQAPTSYLDDGDFVFADGLARIRVGLVLSTARTATIPSEHSRISTCLPYTALTAFGKQREQ
jgi:hypothetical protein